MLIIQSFILQKLILFQKALKALKEIVFQFKKEEEHAVIWRLILNGFLDDDGRVRNMAYYALSSFRGLFLLPYENSSMDLLALKELDKMARDKNNRKLRKNIYRGVIEMRCPWLEEKAKRAGMLREYLRITEEAIKVTGRKMNYVSKSYAEWKEKMGRMIILSMDD